MEIARERETARRVHWDGVYGASRAQDVAWFTPKLALSRDWIVEVLRPPARIVDVGAGASTLVDDLLLDGFTEITLIDLSSLALSMTRHRLQGLRRLTPGVEFVTADVASPQPLGLTQYGQFDLWHDRGVFHYLISEPERERYVAHLLELVRPGGHVVMSTFSARGPDSCTGLPVLRYTKHSLGEALGPAFQLDVSRETRHLTPGGDAHDYLSCRFLRR